MPRCDRVPAVPVVGTRSLVCWLIGQGEDEVVLRSDGVACGVEQHGALGAGVLAGAAGDGERGVGAVVVVGAFDGDLAAGQEGGPGAFPFGLAGGDRADAVAVVGGDRLCVGGVVDRVVPGEHVTQACGVRVELLHGVGDRVLDDVNDDRTS